MKTLVLLCVASAAMSAAMSTRMVTFGPGGSYVPGTDNFTFTEHGAPTSWHPKPSSHATFARVCGSVDCEGWNAAWHGVLDGEVALEWNGVNPSWPGVVRATGNGDFADASSHSGGALSLYLRSSTPHYQGFHVSLGTTEYWNTTDKACGSELGPHQNRGCYKASFTAPAGKWDQVVNIPFSDFSSYWQYGNGNTNRTCEEDTTACICHYSSTTGSHQEH